MTSGWVATGYARLLQASIPQTPGTKGRDVGRRLYRFAENLRGMMQRFMSLPLALRVLIVTLALGALLVLLRGTPALIASTSERVSAFVQGVEGRPLDAEEPAADETSGHTTDAVETAVEGKESKVSEQTEEYLDEVKETNVAAVEAFLEIDKKLRKTGSLTPDDLRVIEDKSEVVGETLDRVERLDPPKEYEEQYELFRSAIVDLDEAAGLAYSIASDPASITPATPERYDLLLDRASFRLQQSDEMLRSHSETTTSGEDN